MCVCTCKIWLCCALKPLVLLSSHEADAEPALAIKLALQECVSARACVCVRPVPCWRLWGVCGLLLLDFFFLKQRTWFYNFIFETLAADFDRVCLGGHNYFLYQCKPCDCLNLCISCSAAHVLQSRSSPVLLLL